MKYIKSFKIFESINQPVIPINEFLQRIRIPNHLINDISNWWMENRSHIKIHFFPFQSSKPIAGVFLGEDTICINERIPMPPHMKLFLALHESRHCDQHKEGRFMDGYYNTVVNNDKESFLRYYKELEEDANDFAISSMRELGFDREMNSEEQRLRGNEGAGNMVYNMMKDDIEKYQPIDFFDLLRKQIS
jgi:hypothetical protein